ncbi:MAG: PilZ domain-containing protein [Deltaproteobacteria bacterium]|nr:PilZ domain-containing protein [Deltaproteobacteria bacterium]MBW2219850.1 PilZ domain-containing protein [Deltaproteobacteria bacterium]
MNILDKKDDPGNKIRFKEGMMTEGLQTEDRRECERFKVAKGIYATFEPHSSRRGQIIDISEKGLAFQYLAGKKNHTAKNLIAIFVSDNGFHLKEIPFKVISDIELKKPNFFSVTQMRRCGGQFGELTSAQAAKLDFFLKNYIVLP